VLVRNYLMADIKSYEVDKQCSAVFPRKNNLKFSMETKDKEQESLVKVPEKGLLSLVAAKLKGRTLFPNQIEEAKKYLKRVTIVEA